MSPRIHSIVWQIVTQSLISGVGRVVSDRSREEIWGALRLCILFLGQTEAPRGKN